MTTLDRERWSRVERVLDLVLDAVPARQDELLEELCAGDPELRADVEAMLRACRDSEGLFEEAPPLTAPAGVPAGDPPGQGERGGGVAPGLVIGHWRVVQELGRGGMGTVFLAERADGQYEKSAALKIVKRGMDSDEILRRFRHERQILAHLEHPHIAGLFDGGRTDDGLPYFVMELARGRPIDEHCDRRRLGVPERLELFLPVCDAVHHAHRNLVVHRDLKPGNIVVVEGQVKLLDFGIAKLLSPDQGPDAAGITQAYSQRLTPRYAAPEQILGQPTTTATDVYSLGVVLYELLCGYAPYRMDGGSLLEMARVVKEVVPRPPSERVESGEPDAEAVAARRSTVPGALHDTLRGDLDAICMKALAKEPGERYESAAALADDIRRHLKGQVVQARRQTRRYRLAKFIRRNRVAVGLAAAAAFSLMLGTAVSLWQARVARQQSALRLEEAERATVARDYLIDWLTTFDPNRLEGQREFTVEEIVQVGFENLGTLEAQPRVRAAVMNTLGRILFNFGDWSEADSVFRAAYRALEPGGDHPDLAVSMMGIGEVWRSRNRYDSALAWFEGALDVRMATLEPDDPRVAETEDALAFTLYNIATGDAEDAVRDSLLERAYALRFEVAGNAELPPLVRASALEGLGDIEVERRDPAAAVTFYRRAYDLRVDELGEANPENGFLLWGLAKALTESGDIDGAEQAYRTALRTLRAVYRESNPSLALAHFNLASFLNDRGRSAEAAREYRSSIAEWEATGVGDHLWAGFSWVGLGQALLEVDSAGAAESALRAGVGVYRRLGDVPPAAVARARADLGRALAVLGRRDEALAELRAGYRGLVGGDPGAAEEIAPIIARLEREATGGS